MFGIWRRTKCTFHKRVNRSEDEIYLVFVVKDLGESFEDKFRRSTFDIL